MYQAVQPSIGARVAVKVLSADLGQDRRWSSASSPRRELST
jgi:hypothetical protein